MRSPNVLLLSGGYYPEISSAAIYNRNFIQAFQGKVSFSVVTTARDRRLPRRECVDGVPVWRVPVSNGRVVKQALVMPRLLRALHFSGFPYQILQLNGFSLTAVAAIFAAKIQRKRILLGVHTAGHDDPQKQRQQKFGYLRFLAYGAADRVVSVSPLLTSQYLAAGLPLEKLVEIPNGVDTSRFRPAQTFPEKMALRARLGLPPELPVILYVGFFSADKAPDLMVRSWLRTRKLGLRSFLVLVGSTDARYFEIDSSFVDEVRGLVAAEGVGRDVCFVERAVEMESYYRAADLFVLPSLRESCPMALLEAMATGLPCVASRLSGATDVLVNHGVDGVLTTPGDVDDLAQSMMTLLRDPAQAAALGHAARVRAESEYSADRMAVAYLQCYRDLLADQACAG